MDFFLGQVVELQDMGNGLLGWFGAPPAPGNGATCDMCEEAINDRDALPSERPILIAFLPCGDCQQIHMAHIDCLLGSIPEAREPVMRATAQFN